MTTGLTGHVLCVRLDSLGDVLLTDGAHGSDRSEALAVFSVLLGLASMWHVLAQPINASPATQAVLAVIESDLDSEAAAQSEEGN